MESAALNNGLATEGRANGFLFPGQALVVEAEPGKGALSNKSSNLREFEWMDGHGNFSVTRASRMMFTSSHVLFVEERGSADFVILALHADTVRSIVELDAE